jgi:hypothetical protein
VVNIIEELSDDEVSASVYFGLEVIQFGFNVRFSARVAVGVSWWENSG